MQIQKGNMKELRRRAEEKLKKQATRLREISKQDMERLVHELGTHQLELEMQNEELRRTQAALEESRTKYSDLYDFAPVGYFTLDRKGVIREANHAGGVMLGWNKRSLISRPFTAFIAGQDYRNFFFHIEEVFRTRTRRTCEVKLKGKDGAEIFAQLQSISFEHGGEPPLYFRMAVIDITERKKAEQEREQALKDERAAREQAEEGKLILDAIMEHIPEGILLAEAPDAKIIMVSRYCEKIVCRTSEEIKRSSPEDRIKKFRMFRTDSATPAQPDDLPLVRAVRRGEVIVNEEWAVHLPGGEERMLLCNAGPIRDKNGNITKGVLAWREITERKKLEEEIRYQATHDLLTKLPNKLLFLDRFKLEMAQARRRNTMLAILFMDIDRFKNINDSLGHDAGDLLLIETAKRIKASVRESDTVSRLGGDEFIIMLSDISADEASAVARKIMETFRRPFRLDGHDISVTTSIGISLFPNDGDIAEDLIKDADIAMYHAKDQGRNNYRFYNGDINFRAVERMTLEKNLSGALDRGELVVHYQPLISIPAQRVVCAEALVRWHHPELGLLAPHRFIPLAEKTGAIIPIDEWVLYTACRQKKIWQDEGYQPFNITVNLSARRFQQPGLVDIVSGILDRTGLDPRYLELDIAETIAMQDRELATLRKLTDMGLHCSMDDFGAGCSSLSYLKKLPIHKLKIDKSLIQGIPGNPDDMAVVNAIINMAHNLDILAVAEGVETEDQIAFLRSSGCDEGQGFLVSEPLPAEYFQKIAGLYQ